jgi:hypothetical protein
MEKKIKICPKCASLNTSIPPSGLDLSLTFSDYCRDCGDRGIFPEVDINKLESFKKKILNKF